jgi:hypothetical protein
MLRVCCDSILRLAAPSSLRVALWIGWCRPTRYMILGFLFLDLSQQVTESSNTDLVLSGAVLLIANPIVSSACRKLHRNYLIDQTGRIREQPRSVVVDTTIRPRRSDSDRVRREACLRIASPPMLRHAMQFAAALCLCCAQKVNVVDVSTYSESGHTPISRGLSGVFYTVLSLQCTMAVVSLLGAIAASWLTLENWLHSHVDNAHRTDTAHEGGPLIAVPISIPPRGTTAPRNRQTIAAVMGASTDTGHGPM